MPSATGTSTLALQTLLISGTAPQALLSIGLTGLPLPPRRRVGYFVLYMYLNAAPFQCYIVDRDVIYAPGLLRKIPVPLLASTYNYRLDANWNESGLAWVATIA